MGMLWYPGQDVDFLTRLANVEKAVRALTVDQSSFGEYDENSPYSITELEAENAELRIRVDDLEELVIALGQEIEDLQVRSAAPIQGV